MTELSDHYMRVRDYARRFSLDESTVYKMIERGEIIPSSELERYLDREPTADTEALSLEQRVEAFGKANGRDPNSFVDAWRSGEIEDTPENAEVALEALALRTALSRRHVAAA
jgi:hypothetical protein